MEANKTAMPMQSNGTALQICDASTGHCVRNVAFCDTPERAAEIVRACNSFDDLVSALRGLVTGLTFLYGDKAFDALKDARSALAKAGVQP